MFRSFPEFLGAVPGRAESEDDNDEKQVVDVNKPKKDRCAWIFFTNEMRLKIKADNPNVNYKSTDLSSIPAQSASIESAPP